MQKVSLIISILLYELLVNMIGNIYSLFEKANSSETRFTAVTTKKCNYCQSRNRVNDTFLKIHHLIFAEQLKENWSFIASTLSGWFAAKSIHFEISPLSPHGKLYIIARFLSSNYSDWLFAGVPCSLYITVTRLYCLISCRLIRITSSSGVVKKGHLFCFRGARIQAFYYNHSG